MTTEDKPIIEMDARERDQVFDDLTLDTRTSILEAARRGVDQDVLVCIAYLVLPDGRRRISSSNLEYGDEEGIASVVEFAHSVKNSGLLKPGERLEVQLMNATNGLTLERSIWGVEAE